jgi:hypothetical protein
METTKFIKNGKELNEKDYNSKGDMVADCDYMQTEELMTKKEILDKYKDVLSTEQIKVLTKPNGV